MSLQNQFASPFNKVSTGVFSAGQRNLLASSNQQQQQLQQPTLGQNNPSSNQFGLVRSNTFTPPSNNLNQFNTLNNTQQTGLRFPNLLSNAPNTLQNNQQNLSLANTNTQGGGLNRSLTLGNQWQNAGQNQFGNNLNYNQGNQQMQNSNLNSNLLTGMGQNTSSQSAFSNFNKPLTQSTLTFPSNANQNFNRSTTGFQTPGAGVNPTQNQFGTLNSTRLPGGVSVSPSKNINLNNSSFTKNDNQLSTTPSQQPGIPNFQSTLQAPQANQLTLGAPSNNQFTASSFQIGAPQQSRLGASTQGISFNPSVQQNNFQPTQFSSTQNALGGSRQPVQNFQQQQQFGPSLGPSQHMSQIQPTGFQQPNQQQTIGSFSLTNQQQPSHQPSVQEVLEWLNKELYIPSFSNIQNYQQLESMRHFIHQMLSEPNFVRLSTDQQLQQLQNQVETFKYTRSTLQERDQKEKIINKASATGNAPGISSQLKTQLNSLNPLRTQPIKRQGKNVQDLCLKLNEEVKAQQSYLKMGKQLVSDIKEEDKKIECQFELTKYRLQSCKSTQQTMADELNDTILVKEFLIKAVDNQIDSIDQAKDVKAFGQQTNQNIIEVSNSDLNKMINIVVGRVKSYSLNADSLLKNVESYQQNLEEGQSREELSENEKLLIASQTTQMIIERSLIVGSLLEQQKKDFIELRENYYSDRLQIEKDKLLRGIPAMSVRELKEQLDLEKLRRIKATVQGQSHLGLAMKDAKEEVNKQTAIVSQGKALGNQMKKSLMIENEIDYKRLNVDRNSVGRRKRDYSSKIQPPEMKGRIMKFEDRFEDQSFIRQRGLRDERMSRSRNISPYNNKSETGEYYSKKVSFSNRQAPNVKDQRLRTVKQGPRNGEATPVVENFSSRRMNNPLI